MHNLRTKILLFLFCTLFLAHAASQEDSQLNQISRGSVKLKILRNGTEIGSATGFLMLKNGKDYLVTNRHVVLACSMDRDPANIGGWLCANKISIFHNRFGHADQWFWVTEDLYDAQGQKRWFEHPTLAGAADLVALPLVHTENVQFYDLNIDMKDADLVVGPADTVTIVGFPFGQSQNAGLPIWKTGTVASDLSTNWSGRPMFLVDTTSRQGMSGAPVYAIRSGAFRSNAGLLKMAVKGVQARFLGVYSEQYQEAELGGVWKADAVKDLYDSLP
jgi:hypothetical protein